MMNRYTFSKQAMLFFAFVALLASCNKDLNLDKWEPQMLLPIVKSSASVKDVADLRDKSFEQNIPPIDIGYEPLLPVNVPASTIGVVGPYGFTLSEFFNSVQIDSAAFDFELTNAFPIPISQGTKIVFRSSTEAASTTNIIYSHTIDEDIPAYGTYARSEVVINKTVTSKIYLFIENFKTPGAAGVTFSNNPSTMKFGVKFLRVFKAGIVTGKEYEVTGTTSMEMLSSATNYADSSATGTLKVFVNSSMPVNFNYQMYFYDESKTVLIDSLYYGSMLSPGCKVDLSGVPYGGPIEKKFEIVFTPERISKLKEAKYMTYRLTGDTKGYQAGVVYINGDCSLQMQITGDVKLKVGALLPG